MRRGKMHQKLKTKFNNLEFFPMGKQISYGGAIEYFDVEIDPLSVIKVIPPRYVKDFYLSMMQINQAIPPHTDSEIKTTINFYVKTKPCRTVFYETKPEFSISQIESQTNGYVFDPEGLTEVSSFVAEVGDAWCLDVTNPHAVEPINGLDERVAICMGTPKYNYEQVCRMLAETGHI